MIQLVAFDRHGDKVYDEGGSLGYIPDAGIMGDAETFVDEAMVQIEEDGGYAEANVYLGIVDEDGEELAGIEFDVGLYDSPNVGAEVEALIDGFLSALDA
jgi:ABC-type glycerol-3-phosphate transport system substrate-binding protein